MKSYWWSKFNVNVTSCPSHSYECHLGGKHLAQKTEGWHTYRVFFNQCVQVFVEVDAQATQHTITPHVDVFILKQTLHDSMLVSVRGTLTCMCWGRQDTDLNRGGCSSVARGVILWLKVSSFIPGSDCPHVKVCFSKPSTLHKSWLPPQNCECGNWVNEKKPL